MAVIFHRLAIAEFVAARRWYAQRSSPAADRFVAAVDATVHVIDATPDLGALFLGRYRWVRTRRFPYLLYYAPTDATTVAVYAVAHASRRLGYWLRRVNRP
jgi:plasmid stabilization system protein ParE